MIQDLLIKYKFFGMRKLYRFGRSILDSAFDFVIDNIPSHSVYTQLLIKRHVSRILHTHFGADEGHNINYSQYFLGFGLIHYALIRNIKPVSILCIGSRTGYIPAILSVACKDNFSGHVDFVDAGFDRDDKKNNWSGIGFWKKIDAKKHFSKLGLSSYISTYVMTTKEFATTYPKKRYQYIYVDGNHSYEGVKLDYSLFWPMLTNGGFMVFHDVHVKWTKNLGKFGVWKLWRELKHTNKIIFPFPKESGLGIIQK